VLVTAGAVSAPVTTEGANANVLATGKLALDTLGVACGALAAALTADVPATAAEPDGLASGFPGFGALQALVAVIASHSIEGSRRFMRAHYNGIGVNQRLRHDGVGRWRLTYGLCGAPNTAPPKFSEPYSSEVGLDAEQGALVRLRQNIDPTDVIRTQVLAYEFARPMKPALGVSWAQAQLGR
jgi:hypothetical protein